LKQLRQEAKGCQDFINRALAGETGVGSAP
jgi:hypothetical protein